MFYVCSVIESCSCYFELVVWCILVINDLFTIYLSTIVDHLFIVMIKSDLIAVINVDTTYTTIIRHTESHVLVRFE